MITESAANTVQSVVKPSMTYLHESGLFGEDNLDSIKYGVQICTH